MGRWLAVTQKPPLGARIDWSNPITKDLVGCWLFNEYSGNKVFDLTDYKNNGVFVSAVRWAGDGVYFDGHSHIDCGSPNFSKDPPFTVILYGDNLGNGDSRSILGYTQYSGFSGWVAKYSQYAYGHHLGLTELNPNADNYSSLLFDNQKFIAISFTADYIKYANEEGMETVTTSVSYGSADTLWIGAYVRYNGEVKDAAVGIFKSLYLFNRALTDDEIKLLHYEPYSFFEVPSMRTVVAFSGGGSAIAYPDTAQISITANDPTASAGSVATPDTAIVTVTAYNPTATAGSTATPEPAVIDVVAYNPTAMAGGAVTPEPAVVNITAYNPIASVGAEVSVDVAIISVVAYDPYATGGLTFDPTFYVYDKDGNGIENVFVELYAQPSNTLVTSGYTDATGKVSFTGVSAGTYLMRFSKAGYMRYEVTAYIEDGDDFKYRLYRSNYLYIGPFGAHVNLGPDDPTNIILG